MSSLKSFTKFPQLPPELRAVVWKLVQQSPRKPRIFHYDPDEIPNDDETEHVQPADLMICHDAWVLQDKPHNYRAIRTVQPSPKFKRPIRTLNPILIFPKDDNALPQGLMNGDIDILNLRHTEDTGAFLTTPSMSFLIPGSDQGIDMRRIKHVQIECAPDQWGLGGDIRDYQHESFLLMLQEIFIHCPDLETLTIWIHLDMEEAEVDEFRSELDMDEYQKLLMNHWQNIDTTTRFESDGRSILSPEQQFLQLYEQVNGGFEQWERDRKRWRDAVRYRVTQYDAPYLP